MKCPKCNAGVVHVRDSRHAEIDGKDTIRRRRVCMECKFRWSTHEILIGDRRQHNALGLLVQLRDDLQKVLTKIDELSKGGENEKS